MDSMQHSVLIKCTYSKTTSSSLLNAPKQHTIQTRSPARKNITTKLLFRLNTSLFWSTKWKGNSSLWPHGASAADIVTNEPVINKTLIYIYICIWLLYLQNMTFFFSCLRYPYHNVNSSIVLTLYNIPKAIQNPTSVTTWLTLPGEF